MNWYIQVLQCVSLNGEYISVVLDPCNLVLKKVCGLDELMIYWQMNVNQKTECGPSYREERKSQMITLKKKEILIKSVTWWFFSPLQQKIKNLKLEKCDFNEAINCFWGSPEVWKLGYYILSPEKIFWISGKI